MTDSKFCEPTTFELPLLQDKETSSGFSRAELEERIVYAKERMNHYKNAFEESDIPAERVFFQNCAEYYINRIAVAEIALERITAPKI